LIAPSARLKAVKVAAALSLSPAFLSSALLSHRTREERKGCDRSGDIEVKPDAQKSVDLWMDT